MTLRLALAAALVATLHAAPQQPPVFRSRADIVTVDVHVVDKDGAPVSDLRPGDFVVTVDGKPRRALVADFISTGAPVPSPPAPTADPSRPPDVPEASLAPGSEPTPRTMLIVVDENNIRSGDARYAMEAALTLVNGASAQDRIGVVTIPVATARVEPTTDRAPVRQALSRITGRLVPVETLLPQVRAVGITEAFAVQQDARAFGLLVARECTGQGGGEIVPGCAQELQIIVRTLAADVRQRMIDSARALTAAIGALGRVPGPKTLVLVSQELSVPNTPGERKDFLFETRAIAEAAARAQVSVYVLQLHSLLFDVATRAHPATASADAYDRSSGLETVTTLTGGRRMMLSGRAEPAFARILRETSGYYVIGFEAEAADRDGKRHTVSVKVTRKGVDVRARREFVFTEQTQDALAAVAPGVRRAPDPAAPPAEAVPPPVAGAPPSPPTAASGALADALARAGAYVLEYGEPLTVMVGVERYSQQLLSAPGGRPVTRQLVSEFALVRMKDDWLAFRDAFNVDATFVRDRQDRLQTLLRDPSQAALDEGRLITGQSARHNLGPFQRNFNVPTTALFFLHLKNQWRFAFEQDGEERLDGEPVWRVRYEEQGRPTTFRTAGGRDMPLRGTVWFSPADGRVLKTHMDVQADNLASITVTYQRDARLGMLVPAEMRETYEGAWAGPATGEASPATITCVATYSDFKRIDAAVRAASPR
jgi:VWFA-related protein